MRAWPVALATLMVGATLAFTEARARQPETAPAKPLLGLPDSLGGRWTVARDLPLSERDLDLLKLSDYASRAYVATEPAAGPVLLYIGYYRSQRTGSTYHSPLNCLPGSGWQIEETGYVGIPGHDEVRVKRLIIERDLKRNVILYWYQDRGRVITNEYSAKAYLIWDGFKWNRTDGALVRISAPIVTTAEEATERALRFATDLWPVLEERLPGPSGS